MVFFFEAEDGIRDLVRSRGLGEVDKRQVFELDLAQGPKNQKVMVDYAVHFVKANGQTSAKVFKWKDTQLDAKGALSAIKKHAIKPITTRVYYAGVHAVEVFVNGASVAKQVFELKL